MGQVTSQYPRPYPAPPPNVATYPPESSWRTYMRNGRFAAAVSPGVAWQHPPVLNPVTSPQKEYELRSSPGSETDPPSRRSSVLYVGVMKLSVVLEIRWWSRPCTTEQTVSVLEFART